MRYVLTIFGTFIATAVCNSWLSYEEYFILPENSDYCQDYPTFRRFSLSRQMSFITGSYNASLNQLFYVCKVRVHPNGRLLHYSYPQGHTSYWFHRLRVNIRFASCGDILTIGFIPEETTQQMLQPEELRLTCTEAFPKIFDSRHRIISLSWHTETGATDLITSELDVQMSAYMRFEGNFEIPDKIQRCEAGSGFWCGNETAVCIYGQMRCDQADGCFDGGTDEVGCPPPRNNTNPTFPTRKARSSWMSYLPWTAICLIPLALIFVLGLICTPRKSLDDLDGEETSNLKFQIPESRTSSSATVSACDSPGSTHSAIPLSQCTTLREPIPRASSHPDSLTYAHVNTTVVNEPTGIEFPRQLSNVLEADYAQLSYNDTKVHLNHISTKLVSLGNSEVGPTRTPKNVTFRNEFVDPLSSANKHNPEFQRICGVENKLFAIPAHFELAAIRSRMNAELSVQQQLQQQQNDSNSSSTESNFEDVTPFRKPDHRTDVLPNGKPNGGQFSTSSSSPNKANMSKISHIVTPSQLLSPPMQLCDQPSDYIVL